MRFKIILFLICVISIFSSCSESKNAKNNHSETAKNNTINEEDFNSFLQNFSKKPTFQRQRVLFPVEATLLDPSDYGMQTVNEKIK